MYTERVKLRETIQEMMYELMIEIQEENKYSNELMASALKMDTRSYCDLKNRNKNCGLETAFFIIIKSYEHNELFDRILKRYRQKE